MADSSMDQALAAAVADSPRFEVIEHNGHHYAVRQSCPRIAKAINKHSDTHDRLVETVIQTTHHALPVMKDGVQVEETIHQHIIEPVLGEDGKPELEPVVDAKKRPRLGEDGKPLMRAKLAPRLDADGKPVVQVVTRPKFELGPRLFQDAHFDTVAEMGSDETSLFGKSLAASARVNDREAAMERAKKT